MKMCNVRWVIVSFAVCGLAVMQGAAQQNGAAAAGSQPVAATPANALLQPAVTSVQGTLQGLKLDKWKKGSVREEAEGNVASLQRDLENNLPALVAAADAAPGSLSKAIPLVKHLDALYDVLLRVEEASRVSAPGEQVAELQAALVKLAAARIALDDQLQAQAAAEEKQIADLQAAARATQQKAETVKTAEATPCKPAAPVRRKKRAAASTTAPAKTQ